MSDTNTSIARHSHVQAVGLATHLTHCALTFARLVLSDSLDTRSANWRTVHGTLPDMGPSLAESKERKRKKMYHRKDYNVYHKQI